MNVGKFFFAQIMKLDEVLGLDRTKTIFALDTTTTITTIGRCLSLFD
jgi:hypothetical protein